MKTIEITTDSQKAVFTPRSVDLDGETFEYTSLLVIRHRPADHLYLISDGQRYGSVSYEDKDAKALHTLFSRIAQLRNIGIDESGPASVTPPVDTSVISPEAAPAQEGNAPTEKDAAAEIPPESSGPSKQTGLLQRPVFLIIEIAVAALLLAIGIYLFFIAY